MKQSTLTIALWAKNPWLRTWVVNNLTVADLDTEFACQQAIAANKEQDHGK